MQADRRAVAGIAGPVAFAAASVLAARRQPGYSARRHHVSGLAAHGTASAAVMVPGFVALGVGQVVFASALRRTGPPAGTSTIVGVAGLASIAAGLCRASSPACPMPPDPATRRTDIRHGAASISAFLCWVALPIRGAGAPGPTSAWPAWHRRLSRALIGPTIATFLAAGATARSGAASRGLAQRAFLATAFANLGATAVASLTTPAPRDDDAVATVPRTRA